MFFYYSKATLNLSVFPNTFVSLCYCRCLNSLLLSSTMEASRKVGEWHMVLYILTYLKLQYTLFKFAVSFSEDLGGGLFLYISKF